jgi:hypothetical protein
MSLLRGFVVFVSLAIGSIASSSSYATSIKTCMINTMISDASELDSKKIYPVFLTSVPDIDTEFLKYLLVLISVESSWRADVVSPAGAVGLMQITKAATDDLGLEFSVDKLKDPAYNIYVGSRFVELLRTRYDTWIEVLIAYNGGGKWVDRFKRGRRMPDETEHFVLKVNYRKERYCD